MKNYLKFPLPTTASWFRLPERVKALEDAPAPTPFELPYKVYTALLTQSGSAAPVATVLENTLSNTVTLSRNNTGNYSITCADFTDVNKVYVELKNINTLLPQPANQFFYFTVTSGVINIRSTQVNFSTLSFTPTDSILDKCPIEIRVYN
jgi:hypothetical protein